ncbi:sulfotransferase 2A1-like [Thomomys bottae]
MAEDCVWFEGIPFPAISTTLEVLKDLRGFVLKDDDVIIVTYPKSGTNWLIEILCLIRTKGDPEWVRSVPIWDRSPWIETHVGQKVISTMEAPRLLSSHLPFRLFPKSLFSSKAKVIYLLRNPRDVLVSGYYFFPKMNLIRKPESLDEYFSWFIRGEVTYGSWFTHVQGWMSMRERENVLLLSYEEMKKDTRGTVEKICQFLGKKLEPKELDLVLENSSFQAMKENKMSNFSLAKLDSDGHSVMMRKGVSGDWKSHFTVAQAEAFDKLFQAKMAGFPPELFSW